MNSNNLAREAHRKILHMIIEGSISPGEALKEAVLGEKLAMSRTPVREAIKRLQMQGLVETNGRFTKVRRISRVEIKEIFFIRIALEPSCARAAVSIAPSQLDEIEKRILALMRDGPGED